MSGGSYNYLCYKDLAQLIESVGDLERMRFRLDFIGLKRDARNTKKIIDSIHALEDLLDDSMNLRDLWKAVEWMDSGDIGLEDVMDLARENRSKANG